MTDDIETWYRISPGAAGVAAAAVSLFGTEKVLSGEWLRPICVRATEGDLTAFLDLLREEAPDVDWVAMRGRW